MNGLLAKFPFIPRERILALQRYASTLQAPKVHSPRRRPRQRRFVFRIPGLDFFPKGARLTRKMTLYRRSNGRWYVRFWLNGQRRMLSTGETDYEQAMFKAKEIIQGASQPAVTKPGITFSQLVEEFTDYIEGHWSPTTVKGDKSRIRRLVNAFGKLKLGEITEHGIDTYMRQRKQGTVIRIKDGERREQKIKGSSVNRELAELRLILKQAVSWRYLESNPCEKVKPFPESRCYDDRRVLSDSERESLLMQCKRSANPILYEIVLVALLTGMRKGELQRLTWDDVDFANGILKIRQTKTNSVFYKPMTDVLKDVLRALRDRLPHGHYVFSKPDGTACGDWANSYETACRNAGLKNVCFHTLRHTCFSYLGMSGFSALEIQAYSGHKSLSMVQRYTHIPPSHVKALADSLGAKMVQSEKDS